VRLQTGAQSARPLKQPGSAQELYSFARLTLKEVLKLRAVTNLDAPDYTSYQQVHLLFGKKPPADERFPAQRFLEPEFSCHQGN
jgi:hypothetical protein